MALPMPPNRTCSIYRAGNAPPAAADVAGVRGHLQGSYRLGREQGEGESSSLRFTHVLYVDVAVDVRDDFDAFTSGGNADTIYMPDAAGVAYKVRFVECLNRRLPTHCKRVYLDRETPAWPIPVNVNIGSPIGVTMPARAGVQMGGLVQMGVFPVVHIGRGGVVAGGALSWSQTRAFTGQAGMEMGGQAVLVHTVTFLADGGVSVGGAAAAFKLQMLLELGSAGGANVGGSAGYSFTPAAAEIYCNDFSTDAGLFNVNGDSVTTITAGVARMVIDGSDSSADNGGLQYDEADIPTSVRFEATCRIVSETGTYNKYIQVNFRQDTPAVSQVGVLQPDHGTGLTTLYVNTVFKTSFATPTGWFDWIQEYDASTGLFSVTIVVGATTYGPYSEDIGTSHNIETIVFKPYSASAADDITVEWDHVCIKEP